MSQDQQEIFVRQRMSELNQAIKKKDRHTVEENLRQQYCKDNNLEYVPQKESKRQDKQQDQQNNRRNQNNNQQQQQSRKNQQQFNEQNQEKNNDKEENDFMKLYHQLSMRNPNTQQRNNRKTQSGQYTHYKKNRNTKRTEKHIKSTWPNHQKQFGSKNKKSKFHHYDYNGFEDDFDSMQNNQQNNQYIDKRDKKRDQEENYQNRDRNDNNKRSDNIQNQSNYQGKGQFRDNFNQRQNNNGGERIERNNNYEQDNYRQNNQKRQERNDREERTRETGIRDRENRNYRDDRNNRNNRNDRQQNDRNNRQNNNNYRRKYDDEYGLDEYEEIDRQEKRRQNQNNQQNKNQWKKKKNIYEQYYSQEEIEKGKTENKIFEGIFLGNESSIQMGNVKCPIFSKKVQINSQIDINRALHGALVAFKIIKVTRLEDEESEVTEEEIQVKLPEIKQQIVQDKEIVIVEDDHDEDWEDLNSDDSEESEESEEEEILYVEKKKEPLTTIQQLQKSKLVGKIVAVLKNPYENRQLVGKIELRDMNRRRTYNGQNKEDFIKFIENNFYLSFKSVNKRLPYFNMKSIQLFNFEYSEEQPLEKFQKYISERYYAVKYTGWQQNERYPYVELVKEVGVVGNIEIECEMILNENMVYDNDFSDICKQELKNFTHDSILQEKQKRLDLTKEYICSIDPVTARDLDDALSIQKVGEGIYEVGVHIADVSHFVRANTEIDKEATLRTTSVYLVHKVIPMLPRMLCEELCSLNRDVERLAFSVFFQMTEEGDVLWNTFRASKSVIKSCAQLSYDIVNQMINGEIQQFSEGEARYAVAEGFDQNVLREKILLLNQIAQKRRQKRLEGSLTFEKGKLRFILDQSLKPIGFQEEKRGLAQFMVEEWMLLANQFVGKKLVEYDKKTAVLRQHMPPKNEKIQYYRQLLQASGLEELSHNLDVSTSKKLKQTLDLINKLENEEIKAVLGFRLLRLMEAAMYFVVDESPEIDWRHYALDFDVYTHFTSPIRRYPDILAHRRLQIALENEEVDQSGETRDKLKAVLEKCNECKLNSRRVSDSCDHLFLALYLKANPVVVDAYILNISQQYFEVIIPQYNLERKVDLKSYQSNYKIISEDINSKKYKIQEKKQQNQEIKQQEEEKEKEKEKRINQIIIFYNDPNDEKGLRLHFIEQFQKIKIRLSGTETFPIEYKIQIIINDDLLI